MNSETKRPLRVGVLCSHCPLDPNTLSGMPFSTWTALENEGLELVDLSGQEIKSVSTSSSQGMRAHPALNGIKSVYRNTRTRIEKAIARPTLHKRIFDESIALSARAQKMVDAAEVDVLFGLCISTILYKLETDLPLIYASDTTAQLINTTYPDFLNSPKRYMKACDEIEGTALRKCTYFIPSSKCTADSAVEHYGVDREKIHIVELGAHVTPGEMDLLRDPPTKDRIELVLVAADPKRKRLGLCIAVAEELRRRGWNATLNYVGPFNRDAERSDVVKWWGRLKLADPEDRETHKGILNRSHWMLLPSIAEAFGIAPCESAHFGRPSVVSDVGGLPTVIQNGKTGAVVPLNGSAAEYADAVLKYSEDENTYRAMSEAAIERAHSTLSWSAWGRRVRTLIEQAVEDRR